MKGKRETPQQVRRAQESAAEAPAGAQAPGPLAARLRLPPLAVQAVLLLALAAGLLAFSDPRIVDDAYITYRHSWNVVQGNGLVFNAGERVEGTTSLTWALLCTLPIATGISPAHFAFVAGLLFAALALLRAWQIARRLGGDPWMAWLGAAGTAVLPGYWLAAGNGLEGGLYALLVVQMVGALLLDRRAWVAGVYGALMFMTRPDSLFLVPLVLLVVALGLRRQTLPEAGTRRATDLAAVLGPWLLGIAGVTLWRLLYYGEFLPNSVIAKRPESYAWESMFPILLLGLEYVGEFALTAIPVVLGTLLLPLLRPRRLSGWLLLGVLAGSAVVAVYNGGDWMRNHRLLVVYTPLYSIALGLALTRMRQALPAGPQRTRRTTRIATVSVGAVLLLGGWVLPLRNHRWTKNGWWIEQSVQEYVNATEAIKDQLSPAAVICSEALGRPGYLLPRHYIHDPVGLADRHLARHGRLDPTFGRWDLRYTANTVRPDVYLTHGGGGLTRLMQIVDAYEGDFLREYAVYLPDSYDFVLALRWKMVPALHPALVRAGLLQYAIKVTPPTAPPSGRQ